MAAALDLTKRALWFISACATLIASRTGDAFVDDSHLGVTSSFEDDHNLTMEDNTRIHELQVTGDLQRLAQHYERLLWSTGGGLNIGKCSWNLISWRWKDGKATLATIEQAPGDLWLTSGDSSIVKERVPRLQPTATYRTLGVFIYGKGCTKRPREILRGYAADFAGKIGPAPINPVTAYFAYHLYLSPELGYPLPVSSFSFKECVHIQAPALMATLPKLKINRNTARAIIHGPRKLGGLQLKHVYCEQGNGQLRLFLGHLRNRDHTGELIIISLSYLQLLVGSTHLSLNLPYAKYAKWVERSWLTSLWEFLDRTRLTVEVRRAWLPQLPREGDSTLMSLFIESGYGGKELAQLNQCRLFHQVFFISDIATANGKQIDGRYRQGVRFLSRRSKWKWPWQGRPGRSSWLVWNRALAHLEDNGKLRVPLGRWLHPTHQQWEWTMHLPSKIVVQEVEGVRRAFRPLVGGITRRTVQLYCLTLQESDTDRLKGDDTWAAVTPIFSDASDEIFTVQTSDALLRKQDTMDTAEDSFSTFRDRLASSAEFFRRLLGPLPTLTSATLETIGFYITEGSLLTCSDGSVDPELETACQAWLMADKDGHLLWYGAGPIDGNPDTVTSYRSELGGITTILFLLLQITQHLELSSGSVTLYCDNSGALDNVFDEYPKRGIYPLLERDYDLLGAARAIRRELPIKVTGVWVKGHYKGDNRGTEHDLNDMADYLATQFQLHPPDGFRPRRMPALHPQYEAVLYNEGSMVNTKFRDIIYSLVFEKALRENIQRRTGWSKSEFDGVAWGAYGSAFRGLTTFRQIATMKLSHDLWNTGAQKKLFNQDPEGLCPACRAALETTDHVFQCSYTDTQALKHELLKAFREELGILGTPSAIIKGLSAGLDWWLVAGGEGPCPRAPGFGRIYGIYVWTTNAYVAQGRLGWGQLLRGRISSLWGTAYVREIKSQEPKQHHLIWSKKVIKLLWDLAFQLWMHRNGILHGTTIAEQLDIRNKLLHQRMAEVFQVYDQDSTCVAAASQHLFEIPLERLLSRYRQYKICWLRLVEAAIAFQRRETEILQCQARRFFGGGKTGVAQLRGANRSETRDSSTDTMGDERVQELTGDITSPVSYNLRRRRRCYLSDERDEDDPEIPPAMFDEGTMSSYSCSHQADVALKGYAPIDASEVAGLLWSSPSLATEEEIVNPESSAGSLSSSYIGEEQPDVVLWGYDPISLSEVRALGQSSSLSPHSLSAPFSDAGLSSSQELVLRSDLSTSAAGDLEDLDLRASLVTGHRNTGVLANASPFSGASSASSFDWARLAFPLQAIGPLRGRIGAGRSSNGSTLGHESYRGSLVVEQEIRYGDLLMPPCLLGQPSVSSVSDKLSVDEAGSLANWSTYTVEAQQIHCLVNRAVHWLLGNTLDNRFPLSSSIYWAIRSLPVFYAADIREAQQQGAPPIIDLHEEEWPDPPDREELGDGQIYPDWLVFILDEVYERHLCSITTRRATLQRRRSLWNLQKWYVKDIPVRELDDPPDSSEGGGSRVSNGIEELSWSQHNIEDNNWRRA